jgi:hypothetical protein
VAPDIGRATPKAGRLPFNPGRFPNALIGPLFLFRMFVVNRAYREMVNKWVIVRAPDPKCGSENYRIG